MQYIFLCVIYSFFTGSSFLGLCVVDSDVNRFAVVEEEDVSEQSQ